MANRKQPIARVKVEGLAPARKGPAAPAGAAVPFRVGHGYDIHRLQAGGGLMLGGVRVSDQFSAIAHSDGDVVIHALVDALLGAMGWGDIGEQFPDTDPRWKGAAGVAFLREIHDRIARAGQRVANVDVTILAERPKLAAFKPQMIDALRDILGASCVVNIKAGTNEGCDAIGRGEAVAAHAVVLLVAAA